MVYPQSGVKDQEYDYFYDNEKDKKVSGVRHQKLQIKV